MTEENGNVTPDEAAPKGIGRRSVLAKGGAVGALAWTTPIVASAPASATTTTCTPKCIPGPPSAPLFTLTRFCAGPGNKWLYVTANVTGATAVCPCGPGGGTPPAPVVTVTGTQFFDTNAGGGCTGGAALTLTNGDATDEAGVVYTGGFLLSANGAVGSGCIYGCVRVTVRCQDRTGDYSYSYCDMKVSFTSTPADGSCGARLENQTGTPTVTSCGSGCTAPTAITSC